MLLDLIGDVVYFFLYITVHFLKLHSKNYVLLCFFSDCF